MTPHDGVTSLGVCLHTHMHTHTRAHTHEASGLHPHPTRNCPPAQSRHGY